MVNKKRIIARPTTILTGKLIKLYYKDTFEVTNLSSCIVGNSKEKRRIVNFTSSLWLLFTSLGFLLKSNMIFIVVAVVVDLRTSMLPLLRIVCCQY